MRKNVISLLLALVCSFPDRLRRRHSRLSDETDAADGTWAVYWYLCGSDLESGGGFATSDLSELMEVELPEEVNVVIRLGGSLRLAETILWTRRKAPALGIQQRGAFTGGRAALRQHGRRGHAGGLPALCQGKLSRPAARLFVFWNHGGGSVSARSLR